MRESRNYLPRADLTASTNARAFAVIVVQSFFAIASLLTRADPAPRNTAPALIHSPAFFKSSPPVGVSLSCGRGASRSLKYVGPSAVDGKTLTTSAPADEARMISVGVNAPGMLILPSRRVFSTIFLWNLGETINSAPADI